jgi:hypothetical protein
MHFDGAVGGDGAFDSADEAQGVGVFGAGEMWLLDVCRRFEVSAPREAAAVLSAFTEFGCHLDEDVAGGGDDLGAAALGTLGDLGLLGWLCGLRHAGPFPRMVELGSSSRG